MPLLPPIKGDIFINTVANFNNTKSKHKTQKNADFIAPVEVGTGGGEFI